MKQTERSQVGKTTYCMITTLWHSGIGKIMESVKRLMMARSSGEGESEKVENKGFLEQ